MGGFAMVIGGALKGVGTYGEGVREERLKKLAEDRADARSERDMAFRSQEAEVARSAQVQENIRSEGVQAGEAEKTRAAQGNSLQTDSEGNTVSVNAGTGKAIAVTTPDGKNLKLLPKATDSTEEIKNAEYMLRNGIAKNANEAWTKANRLKDKDPGVIRDTIYRDWIRTLGASGSYDDAQIDEMANKRADEYMAKNYPDDSGGDPAASSGPFEAAGGRPPEKPEDRRIGNLYRAANGSVVRWTDKGWELVMTKRD